MIRHLPRLTATTVVKTLCLACAVVALLGMTIEARAATLLVDGSGQLIGAKGIDVGGTPYDVAFVEGSCISIYDGCDDPSDLDFTTQAEAKLAAQALLDQVFLDAPEGMFDSAPELTFGCSSTWQCKALIPWAPDSFAASGAWANNGSLSDYIDVGGILVFYDTSAAPTNVYARFMMAISVTVVSIDIKPGSDPNSINISSAGLIPVAILSSDTFDATTVDPETIFLAGAGVKLAGKGLLCNEEFVNDDDYLDLVCHIETAEFLIEPGETTAELTAETFDGTPIKGTDSIKIVPRQ